MSICCSAACGILPTWVSRIVPGRYVVATHLRSNSPRHRVAPISIALPSRSGAGMEFEIKLMADWLRTLPVPVGLFACNDDRGRQVLEASRLAQLVAPEDTRRARSPQRHGALRARRSPIVEYRTRCRSGRISRGRAARRNDAGTHDQTATDHRRTDSRSRAAVHP